MENAITRNRNDGFVVQLPIADRHRETTYQHS
jgi:hypothetical protein